MLKVDLSNVWGDLSLPDLLATEQESSPRTRRWPRAAVPAMIFSLAGAAHV